MTSKNNGLKVIFLLAVGTLAWIAEFWEMVYYLFGMYTTVIVNLFNRLDKKEVKRDVKNN
jgi:hypothetical protein